MPSMLEKLDAILALQGPRKGPKLTAMDMGAAFAAAKRGFKHWAIAKAFDLSTASVSTMATAKPDGKRYAKLAREWERLGADRFAEKYLNEHNIEVLMRITMQQTQPTDVRIRPSDEKAAKYKGTYELWSDDQGCMLTMEIGYRQAGEDVNWQMDDGDGSIRLPARWAARDMRWPDRWSVERFRTSHDMWDWMCTSNGIENPRKRAGRPPQE